MDKGYDSASVRDMIQNLFDFISQVRGRGGEKKLLHKCRKRARRWIVVRAHSGTNHIQAIVA